MSHGSSKEYEFALTRVWWPAMRSEVGGSYSEPETLSPPDDGDWELCDVRAFGYSSETAESGTQEEVLLALWRKKR